MMTEYCAICGKAVSEKKAVWGTGPICDDSGCYTGNVPFCSKKCLLADRNARRRSKGGWFGDSHRHRLAAIKGAMTKGQKAHIIVMKLKRAKSKDFKVPTVPKDGVTYTNKMKGKPTFFG